MLELLTGCTTHVAIGLIVYMLTSAAVSVVVGRAIHYGRDGSV